MTFHRREIELHNERRVGLVAAFPPFPSGEPEGSSRSFRADIVGQIPPA
jgi:hypothetical protein